jgi:hypothetical protein
MELWGVNSLESTSEFSDFSLDVVELLFELLECFAVDVDKLHGCSVFEVDQMQLQWSGSQLRPFIE